jgi:hypothetical protein
MAIVLDGTSGITTPALDSVARFATADMPIGSVLQMVSATTATETTITATSFTDITNLSASITPTSASSKILVVVQLSGRMYIGANANRKFFTNIVRASTQIHEIATSDLQSGVGASGFAIWPLMSSLIYLDSPATTSSTTYKCQAKVSDSASSTVMVFNTDTGSSTIVLMEIAA